MSNRLAFRGHLRDTCLQNETVPHFNRERHHCRRRRALSVSAAEPIPSLHAKRTENTNSTSCGQSLSHHRKGSDSLFVEAHARWRKGTELVQHLRQVLSPRVQPKNEKNQNKAACRNNTLTHQGSSGRSLMRLVCEYVIADIRRRPSSIIVAFITLVFVIVFATFVRNVLAFAPLAFLKAAQDTVGTTDLIFIPQSVSKTKLDFARLANISAIRGAFPRWILPVSVVELTDQLVSSVSLSHSKSFRKSEGSPMSVAQAVILVLDSETEAQIAGLSASWPHRQLGLGEAHVSSTLLRALGVTANSGARIATIMDMLKLIPSGTRLARNTIVEGDDIIANLTAQQIALVALYSGANASAVIDQCQLVPGTKPKLFRTSLKTATNNTLCRLTCVQFTFTVVGGLEPHTYGKYSSSLGSILLAERSHMNLLLRRAFHTIIKSPLAQLVMPRQVYNNSKVVELAIEDVTLDDKVQLVNVVLENRGFLYLQHPDKIWKSLVGASNLIASEIKKSLSAEWPSTTQAKKHKSLDLLSNATVIDAIFQGLQATALHRIFLEELFFTATIMLTLLVFALIYALLFVEVEQKTREFAILRTLGMPKLGVFATLVLLCAFFAIPATAMALVFCGALHHSASKYLSGFLEERSMLLLDFGAGALAVGIGIFVPTVALMIPAQRALGSTLREALALHTSSLSNAQQQAAEFYAHILSSGVRPGQILIAVFVFISGAAIYYPIPFAFINREPSLFFRILTLELLGFVTGCVTLALKILWSPIEALVQWVLVSLICREPNLLSLVRTSAASHVTRNQLTATMYTAIVTFLACTGAMYKLQASLVSDTVAWTVGSSISISSNSVNDPLPEEKIRAVLTASWARPIVGGFTFVTWPLHEYSELIEQTQISDIAQEMTPAVSFVGIDSDFPLAVNSSYLHLSEYNEKIVSMSDFERISDAFSELENSKNLMIPLIISESVARKLSISLRNGNSMVRIDTLYKPSKLKWPEPVRWIGKCIAVARKMPGFTGLAQSAIASGSSKTENKRGGHSGSSIIFVGMRDFVRVYKTIGERAGNTSISGIVNLSDRKKEDRPLAQEFPKQRLFVRINDGVPENDQNRLVDQLRSTFATSRSGKISMRVLADELNATSDSSNFVEVMFAFVIAGGLISCLVAQIIAARANIQSSRREFGVLRALGMSRAMLIRCVVYENSSIVICAATIGAIIGLPVAALMSGLYSLLSDLPATLHCYPWSTIVVATSSSVVLAAITASYLALHTTRVPPAHLHRGNAFVA